MKKLLLILAIGLTLILTGCSSVSERMPKETVSLSAVKTFEISYLKSTKYRNKWLVSHDGSIELKIKNLTNEVKYLNWSSSSLTYNSFTSRITTGNDRIKNLNSTVPNTAILPNSTLNITILPADALDVQIYPAATYVNVEPPLETASEITLILSFSGNDTSKLEQEIYSFKF